MHASTNPHASAMYLISERWRRSSAVIASIPKEAAEFPQAGHVVPASTGFPH